MHVKMGIQPLKVVDTLQKEEKFKNPSAREEIISFC